jgi:hypothetical protein
VRDRTSVVPHSSLIRLCNTSRQASDNYCDTKQTSYSSFLCLRSELKLTHGNSGHGRARPASPYSGFITGHGHRDQLQQHTTNPGSGLHEYSYGYRVHGSQQRTTVVQPWYSAPFFDWKSWNTCTRMPGTLEEKAPLPIIDPTSATEEEIDPAVDRDRIRVVRSMRCGSRAQKLIICSLPAQQTPPPHFRLMARTTR